jgi:hypothetical protein
MVWLVGNDEASPTQTNCDSNEHGYMMGKIVKLRICVVISI